MPIKNIREWIQDFSRGRLSRRDFVQRASAAGIGLLATESVLASVDQQKKPRVSTKPTMETRTALSSALSTTLGVRTRYRKKRACSEEENTVRRIAAVSGQSARAPTASLSHFGGDR